MPKANSIRKYVRSLIHILALGPGNSDTRWVGTFESLRHLMTVAVPACHDHNISLLFRLHCKNSFRDVQECVNHSEIQLSSDRSFLVMSHTRYFYPHLIGVIVPHTMSTPLSLMPPYMKFLRLLFQAQSCDGSEFQP